MIASSLSNSHSTSASPTNAFGQAAHRSADRSRSKKRGSDQNARPITRGGEDRAGIPEVPFGDAARRVLNRLRRYRLGLREVRSAPPDGTRTRRRVSFIGGRSDLSAPKPPLRPSFDISSPPYSAGFQLGDGSWEVLASSELIDALSRDAQQHCDLRDSHELLISHMTERTC
jgi:hypothetical protein